MKTFPIWLFSELSDLCYFELSFPQQVSVRENHWFFHRFPLFRSSTGWSLFLAIAVILVLPTCALACKLILRRLLLQPFQVMEILYPGILLPQCQDPCSGNIALCSPSSLTLSFPEHDSPLYFWKCCTSSECLRWQRSMRDAR